MSAEDQERFPLSNTRYVSGYVINYLMQEIIQ